MFTCLFLIVSCIVTLGIGGLIFGLSIYNDIKNDLSSIRECRNTTNKKILLQIETNMQKLPEFQCFGSITCERVAVKHVSIKLYI